MCCKVLNGNGNAERFAHFIDDLGHHRYAGGINNNEVILVVDKVRFHSSDIVRERNELRGCTVKFLPAYSSHLNPIESLFSQWKLHLKSVLSKNEGELLAAINNICNIVNAGHCRNYIRHVHSNCLKIIDGKRKNFE